MSPEPRANGSTKQAGERPPACCPFYHEAVELIGRRWTGAIVAVLLDHGPLRFSEIAQAVPELSDRLLSERMKELEATLLRYLKALVEGQARPPMHLHEEAREAGWTDEQILESVAVVALETFTAMVNVAGEVPVDGSTENTRTLKAA